jgi:glutamate-5-semialdehyde dehydrogenase (EC 1.2.1.41)
LEVEVKAKQAKAAARRMAVLDENTKNLALNHMADALIKDMGKILEAK